MSKLVTILSAGKRGFQKVFSFYRFLFTKILSVRTYGSNKLQQGSYLQGIVMLLAFYGLLLGYAAWTAVVAIIAFIYLGPWALVLYLICRLTGVCII